MAIYTMIKHRNEIESRDVSLFHPFPCHLPMSYHSLALESKPINHVIMRIFVVWTRSHNFGIGYKVNKDRSQSETDSITNFANE